MNNTKYTEFKNIPVGTKFMDAAGMVHTKMNDTTARHDDVRYNVGFKDYQFDADDRLRIVD